MVVFRRPSDSYTRAIGHDRPKSFALQLRGKRDCGNTKVHVQSSTFRDRKYKYGALLSFRNSPFANATCTIIFAIFSADLIAR